MSLLAKISLAVWILVALTLFFFFTFTLFLVALIAGFVILVLNQLKKGPEQYRRGDEPIPFQEPVRTYRRTNTSDDDIIDV